MRQTDTGFLLETARPSILPKKVIYILVRARTSPKIVRWAFLLFVFTIPFEAIDLQAISGASSVSRIGGLLFFSTSLFYSKVFFRRPPQALWWFVGYISVFALSGLYIPEQSVDQLIASLQTLIQLLVLCWLSSTLLQEEKFARHTVLTFSIATLVSAIGMLLHLPGFSVALKESQEGVRWSVTGFNPNGLAILMALATQALIWLGIDQTSRSRWMRATFMAMSLLPLTAMVYTGSRAGITAFLAGVALYALPYRGSKRKMTALLGIAFAVVSVIYTVVNDQIAFSRLESTYERGASAGRNKIFPAAVEMISEKPLLGWGPAGYAYELGARSGKKYIGAHNLFLDMLLGAGLFGATPFLIGLGLCVRAAWVARVRGLGLLPLVWLTAMIVGNMTHSWLTDKSLWLVLALSLASGAFPVKQYKRKSLMVKT